MLHLSLEDIDNNIDQACSEVMEEALTIILTGANPAWLDIDIMSLDQIKVELQRLSLSLHAFIESNDTRNKTNITTSEVINLEIDGEGLCVPVTITATLNKKEPAVKESWSSDSEKKAFEGMQKVLDNMDELVDQYDDECVKIVSEEIMAKVSDSITSIIKKKIGKVHKDAIYSEEVREQAVNNILDRLKTKKDSHAYKPPSLEKIEALIEEIGPIVQVIDVPPGITIEKPKLEELSLRQLIRKYQFELLQIQKLFPSVEIFKITEVYPKILDLFFPLTTGMIESKIDVSMPHMLPSMLRAFVIELDEQGYILIYKPNIPW
jgi:hypothetical protein